MRRSCCGTRRAHAGAAFVLVGQQYLADPQRSAGHIQPVYTYAHVPRVTLLGQPAAQRPLAVVCSLACGSLLLVDSYFRILL